MAIYLIRHGETDANAARVVQLPTVPLSERGRDQATRLAARLAGGRAAAVGQHLRHDRGRAGVSHGRAARLQRASPAAVRRSPGVNDGALAGRTAVVTGATSGIGRETARALLQRGARLVIVARSR